MRLRAAAALVAALALAGCGGGEDEAGTTGGLTWSARPLLLAQGAAPDRVLQGQVRNDSLRPLKLRAKDVRLVDGDGTPVQASVVFAAGLTKPLYRVDRPYVVQAYDFRRLGIEVDLKPGEQAPMTVAWRVPAAPVRIDYGAGSLAIGEPERVTDGSTRRAR